MLDVLYAIMAFASFGIGFIAAMLGVGGGFLLVPTLIFAGLSAHEAVGTSLASVMFTGMSSFVEYSKQGRIDWRTALILEGATVPGSILGSYLTTLVSSKRLEFLFGLMLIAISIFMSRKTEKAPTSSKLSYFKGFSWSRSITDENGERFVYKVNLLPALLFAFAAGVSVGFFGISGGILKVPILLLCGTPIYVAIATSSLMITITSTVAFVSHAFLGNIEFQYLLFTVPGVILGAQLGAKTSEKIHSQILRKMFSLVLLMVAVTTLMNWLSN